MLPNFKRLLQEGKLKQPNGPRTPYFLAESDTDDKSEWPSVKKIALDTDTGEEYQITFPATRVVKPALLNFDYPPTGIRITDIAEALAEQFELTEEQRVAKGKIRLGLAISRKYRCDQFGKFRTTFENKTWLDYQYRAA